MSVNFKKFQFEFELHTVLCDCDRVRQYHNIVTYRVYVTFNSLFKNTTCFPTFIYEHNI